MYVTGPMKLARSDLLNDFDQEEEIEREREKGRRGWGVRERANKIRIKMRGYDR